MASQNARKRERERETKYQREIPKYQREKSKCQREDQNGRKKAKMLEGEAKTPERERELKEVAGIRERYKRNTDMQSKKAQTLTQSVKVSSLDVTKIVGIYLSETH